MTKVQPARGATSNRVITAKPNWETSASLLIVLLESGDYEGKAYAKSEVMRMGKIIDELVGAMGAQVAAAETDCGA